MNQAFNELLLNSDVSNKYLWGMFRESNTIWISIFGTDKVCVFWNKGAEMISGYPRDEVVGNSNIDELLQTEASSKDVQFNSISELLSNENSGSVLIKLRDSGGKQHYLETSVDKISMPDESFNGWIVMGIDITCHVHAKEKLTMTEADLSFLADSISDVIWQVDHGFTFTYVSSADKKMRGFSKEEVIGKKLWEFLLPEDIQMIKNLQAERMLRDVAGTTVGTKLYELQILCKDSKRIWVEVSVNPVISDGILTGYQGINRDITERKLMESQLQVYATTDLMTGAVNRRTGVTILEKLLASSKMSGESFAVCFLDIDGLKKTNDTYGHAAGDELITRAAAILRKCIRKTDTLCRFGGDEFLLILPECDNAGIEELLARIHKYLDNKESVDATISFSIGIVVYNDGMSDTSADDIISQADRRMYEDKSKKNKK